ncbi:hypothetical protein [Novilysobacter luteus]|uniref:Lysozyme inhibitor LprI N-terminal domain-containing protein n=1 Tax=Novilysobacter luteus TaxID=2822368 RepID=A0ABM8UC08_9GAMM|nr:hypothetical protein [Lysobacter luteus]CAG4967948.1 hypothetical protein LYB30171_00158 [Lysobacter luteus]
MLPNSSFKPNPLRSTNDMAERACHAVGSATQVGLTQVLGNRGRLMQLLKPLTLLFILLPSVAHAEDKLTGIEYPASVVAPGTRDICESLVNGYASRFDPIYERWVASRKEQIAVGRLAIAAKLDPGQAIEQFEEAARWKNAQEFDAASDEKKASKCASFYNLFNSSLNPSQPPSAKSAQPSLRLSCELIEPKQNRRLDFIAGVDFANGLVTLDSKLEYPANITDSSISWEVEIEGTDFFFNINRYTGATRYGNAEFPSIYSGTCQKASERRF